MTPARPTRFRWFHLLLLAQVVGTLLAAPLAAQGGGTLQNPFIPGEAVGVIAEDRSILTESGAAQDKLNSTLACSLLTVYLLALHPLLFIGMVGGILFYLFKGIRAGDTDAFTKVFWNVIGLMIISMPVTSINDATKNIPLLQAGMYYVIGPEAAKSCAASASAWLKVVDTGNSVP